jgi:hypothetical protein
VACTAVLLLARLGGGVSTSAFADVYSRLPHGEGFRNVRDFGAKGDGISDDTSAFIRALEVGRGGKGMREKTPANGGADGLDQTIRKGLRGRVWRDGHVRRELSRVRRGVSAAIDPMNTAFEKE